MYYATRDFVRSFCIELHPALAVFNAVFVYTQPMVVHNTTASYHYRYWHARIANLCPTANNRPDCFHSTALSLINVQICLLHSELSRAVGARTRKDLRG